MSTASPSDRIGKWTHRRITCLPCRDDRLHRQPVDGSATWECGEYTADEQWHATVHTPNLATALLRERDSTPAEPSNGAGEREVPIDPLGLPDGWEHVPTSPVGLAVKEYRHTSGARVQRFDAHEPGLFILRGADGSARRHYGTRDRRHAMHLAVPGSVPELAATPAPVSDGPGADPMHNANGNTLVCRGCKRTVDAPHSWAECTAGLRAEVDRAIGQGIDELATLRARAEGAERERDVDRAYLADFARLLEIVDDAEKDRADTSARTCGRTHWLQIVACSKAKVVPAPAPERVQALDAVTRDENVRALLAAIDDAEEKRPGGEWLHPGYWSDVLRARAALETKP